MRSLQPVTATSRLARGLSRATCCSTSEAVTARPGRPSRIQQLSWLVLSDPSVQWGYCFKCYHRVEGGLYGYTVLPSIQVSQLKPKAFCTANFLGQDIAMVCILLTKWCSPAYILGTVCEAGRSMNFGLS